MKDGNLLMKAAELDLHGGQYVCGVHAFDIIVKCVTVPLWRAKSDLTSVSKLCYLGLVYTPSGGFNSALKHLYDKVSKALFSLRSSLRHLPSIHVNTQIKIFDTMIKPILLFGSEVWGPYILNLSPLDTFASIFSNYKHYLKSYIQNFVKLPL